MTSPMPAIHFIPRVLPEPGSLKTPATSKNVSPDKLHRDSEDEDDCDESMRYKCPVYKTSVRAGTLSTTGQSTNYILAIDIPMAEAGMQEHWALRGTAMITMLNE